MKKLTLITAVLLSFSMSGLSQKKKELDSRFACPNEKRDSLFVTNEMVDLMTMIWDEPEYKTTKPHIVPVSTLAPYIKRFNLGLDLKARMK